MFIRFILTLTLWFAVVVKACAQSPIEPIDAVQLMENFERKVAFVEFEQKAFETFATEVDGNWTIVKPTRPSFKETEFGAYSSRYDVVFSPIEQYFLVKCKTVFKSAIKADGSKNDVYTFDVHDSKYSFDGEQFKCQVVGQRYKTPPTNFDSKGDANWGSQTGMRVENYGILSTWESHPNYIGDGKKTAIEKFGNGWGVRAVGCMAWTDFESPVLLSKYLRQKIAAGEKIVVRQKSKDTLEIYCPILKSHTHPYGIKFFYDSVRGRLKRVEWGGCVACKGDLDPDDWWANRLGLLEYDDETVLPAVLNQIELPVKPAGYTSGTKYKAFHSQFTQRRVSHTKIDKGTISFDFAPGVEVSDYIRKRVYIVGEGLEDDIKSTEKFMQLNDLVQTETIEPRGFSRWLSLAMVAGLIVFSALLIRKRFLLMILFTVGLSLFESGTENSQSMYFWQRFKG